MIYFIEKIIKISYGLSIVLEFYNDV